MPTKKKSFLFDPSEFERSLLGNNLQNFEKSLMELMDLANEYYNKIYLKCENNPDIEKFSICSEKFSQIKSIIELKKVFTPPIDELYLEACISTLYSDKHALNLEPETDDQLNILSHKIQKIGREFQQLLLKKSGLDSNNQTSSRLLKYIENFKHCWITDEKKLLADATFNFAETLVEQENFQQAIDQFEKAKNLYTEAAHVADNTKDNKMLLKFSNQTRERLEVIKREMKTQPSEDYSNKLFKELSIRLQRMPDSPSKWTIVNESSPPQLIEEKKTMDVKNFNEEMDLSLKVKRKSNEELTPPETKKQRKNRIVPSTTYPRKIKFRWKIECEQLLKKLDEITTENYKILSASPNQYELIRFKASLASQYAINVIEKLISTHEKLDDTKKLDCLEEAEKAFENSISFYNQLGLIREKGKLIQCQNTLISTINEFKISIYPEKLLLKPNVISRTSEVPLFKPKIVDLGVYQSTPTKSKDASPINSEKHRTKTVISLSKEKFLKYQHTYSTRYVQNFFRDYSLDQNVNIHQNPKIVGP